VLEVEGGSTRSLCLENSLWKKLWTCRKIEYITVMMIIKMTTTATTTMMVNHPIIDAMGS
jgi:hypothetical protein